MIQRQQIHNGLHAKREKFVTWQDGFHSEALHYRRALKQLAELSADEIQTRLDSTPAPGALPTAEFDLAKKLRLPFEPCWSNHQEARTWAHAALLEHVTIAADGSQIQPGNDFSVPVAAVQVAWFVNHHTPEGNYEKNIELEILAPDELQVTFKGEHVISEQVVNFRRFTLEVTTLCRLMQELSGQLTPGQRTPLVFFDSSLVISFADRLQEPQRSAYVAQVLRLLRASEKTGIPLIGYVDTSAARDLTHMLAYCFALPAASSLQDAQLVNELLQWGDRTPLFICARGSADKKQPGVLDSFAEYRRRIGFVYLKTNATAPPARLDIPMWIYERGLLEQVLDLVRGEVIAGNGYPYSIAAADAAAVITARDREIFQAVFQQFAAEENVELRLSQKAASKTRRR